MPLLGCAPSAQLCINTQFWPNVTQQMKLSADPFIPIYVTCILVFLVFAFIVVFMGCHTRRYFSFVRQSNV
jgi:hypothetical protein